MVTRRRQGGFTATEILVVLGIVGILAAIAVPSLSQMIQQQSVRSASYDLNADLVFARSEAISRATSVTITGSHFQDSANPVVGVQVGGYQVPAADFSVGDASHLTVAFPAAADVIPPNDQTDGAGRVQVTVTLQDDETSAVNVNSWFTYVDDNGSSQPLPTVTTAVRVASRA